MIAKKIIILISLVVFVHCLTQAPSHRENLQFYFKNFPNSPSTATFLRYGDIQNNEFVGANTPQVPIYNIKEGAIEIPLSLDYISGNGIKVADESGSVGLGWNIGLPTITQSVMGYDDFDVDENHQNLKIDLHYENTPWPALNFSGKYLESKEMPEPPGYIHAPQNDKFAYYYSSNYCLPVNNQFHNYSTGQQYDVSPDIFSLNLFGQKVQFIIENHKDIETQGVVRQFTSLNANGYKITYENNSFFKIIAPDGLVYEFSKSETIKIFGVISRNYLLTKVVDLDNNTINLMYENYTDIINLTPFSGNLNYTYSLTNSTNSCGGIPAYWGNIYVATGKLNRSDSSFPFDSGPEGTFRIPITPNYGSKQNYLLISEISGNFGKVKFNYSNRDDFPTKKVDNISVYSTDETKSIKSINFNYDYFVSPDYASNPDNRLKKRLKLRSMSINQDEQYRFEYYENNQLPAKNSYAVDYWGFSNGGIDNKTYFLNPLDFGFPEYYNLPIHNQFNNNKKKADISYCVAGTISRIIYPTQGYSVFEYELNNASNLFVSNYSPKLNEGKGLRIKTQKNYDSNDNLLGTTKLIYEGGFSTNPLDLITRYTYRYNFTTESGAVNGGFNASVLSMNATNNYSASPLSSGDYVGYTKVRRIELDKSNKDNGQTITTYSFTPDQFYKFFDDQLPVNIPSVKGTGIENGKILEQSIYNKDNKLLKLITNQYIERFSKNYYGSTLSMINEGLYVCTCITNGGSCPAGNPNPNHFINLSVVAHFPIFHKESLLSSSETKEYLDGGVIINKVTTNYNSYNYPETKTTFGSSGDIVKETTFYTSRIPRFFTNNVFSKIFAKELVKNNTLISKQTYNYNNFTHLNLTSIDELILPQNIYTTSRFDQYDKYGNLQEYALDNKIPVAVVWGYNNKLPIAIVEGATYPDSNAPQGSGLETDIPDNFINTIINASNKDNNPAYFGLTSLESEQLLLDALMDFQKKPELSKTQITAYTYDPLIGITNIIKPNGIKEKYTYNASGKLSSILDTDGNPVKEFLYNFNSLSPSLLHFNTIQEQTFTRSNCGIGYTGGQFTYSVPANRYSSFISQIDADQKAIGEITLNGQVMANQLGECIENLSCGFLKNPSLSVWSGTFTNISSKIYGNIALNPPATNWSTEVYLGTIQDSCIPATLKTLSYVEAHDSIYRQWEIKIYPSGNLTVRLIYGSVVPNTGIPILLNNFIYTKN
ncbi:hypothetical protein KSK37_10465 [Kaistella sp. DKR-2]|uniref:DUF5977 domain-containing protein n=1 Tax=Kaistella soli TaxID=2849654 RepID=UPI001C2703EE|nr:DUF5977 domain-containing protein [Kaistella soli]MBU8883506.1 hypothetical protein [Kaistella soli]